MLPVVLQRQSGEWCNNIQTGFPSEPARCAMAVSLVITKSSVCIKPAVSIKASDPVSMIGKLSEHSQKTNQNHFESTHAKHTHITKDLASC